MKGKRFTEEQIIGILNESEPRLATDLRPGAWGLRNRRRLADRES